MLMLSFSFKCGVFAAPTFLRPSKSHWDVYAGIDDNIYSGNGDQAEEHCPKWLKVNLQIKAGT